MLSPQEPACLPQEPYSYLRPFGKVSLEGPSEFPDFRVGGSVSTGIRAAPTEPWNQTKKMSGVHFQVIGMSTPNSANKVLS